MIDMIAALGVSVEIAYLDTQFLFPETIDLRDRLSRRYPTLCFVNRGNAMSPAEQERIHGPELWSREPDLCCRIRKVEPMRQLLRNADAWMTGIRRDQSSTRSSVETIVWDSSFEIVKISPLAPWSREQVYQYVRERDVPISPLHDAGYPTFGCTHCTRPVEGARPTDYSRAGRWSGTGKTECGLHTDPLTGRIGRA
jgi:phosphoadenosine phosphosulfate reductase